MKIFTKQTKYYVRFHNFHSPTERRVRVHSWLESDLSSLILLNSSSVFIRCHLNVLLCMRTRTNSFIETRKSANTYSFFHPRNLSFPKREALVYENAPQICVKYWVHDRVKWSNVGNEDISDDIGRRNSDEASYNCTMNRQPTDNLRSYDYGYLEGKIKSLVKVFLGLCIFWPAARAFPAAGAATAFRELKNSVTMKT